MTQITAMFQIDVRNPNDKFIFDLFGMLEPSGPIINYVKPMVSSDVLYWFERFATKAAMAMVIGARTPSEATALHRIFSLWREPRTIDIVNLIVQNRTYVGNEKASIVIKPMVKFTQAKITHVRPVTGDSGNAYHIVDLSIAGRRHWTERGRPIALRSCGLNRFVLFLTDRVKSKSVERDQKMQQLCRKKIGKILFVILSISFLLRPDPAQANPKTVTDYYLALPGGVYGIKGTQDSEIPGFEDDFLFYANERNESRSAISKYRNSLIKIEDTKNGYLRLESDKWEGWAELALFKKGDGTNLLAIAQVEWGGGCRGGLLFLTYKSGEWKNVTRQVFPANSPMGNYFKLPLVGTTIQLICGDESNQSCKPRKVLAEFEWNKQTFVKKMANS